MHENQITFFEGIETTALTDRQVVARNEHQSIISNANAARSNMIACCQSLKRIRDEKLYTEFGFNEFEQYTESAHSIKLRQAYNLISIVERNSEEFLQANAKLGLTKLIAISKLPDEQKQEIIEGGKIEDMSTREVTEEVKRLQDELAQKDVEINEKQAQISLLEDKIDEEKRKEVKSTTISGDLINKKAKEIADEQIKAINKQRKEAENRAKLVEENAKQTAEQLETAKKELEKAKVYKELIDQAEAEKEAIKKEMAISVNPELIKFKYIFEKFQNVLAELNEQLNMLDENDRDKCQTAINTVLERWGL